MEQIDKVTGHSITLDACKKLTATAIEEVEGFSPQQIVLLYGGGKIVITGSGLKIIGFSKSGGTFAATGNVSGIKYGAKGVSLGKRIFK